jgi:GT2 family glycosyltransferase
MGVGIVIATCDDGDTLLPTLDRLVALPERPPIVVVDNGSAQDLAATVAAAGHRPDDVETITLRADCGPAARTIGAHRLTTELVAFCDDDSWFAPGALAAAADRFACDPLLALLQARVLVGEAERLDPVCACMAGAPAVLGFLACGVVVRRRALLAIGAFEHCGRFGGEESPTALDLAAAGWRLAYDPAVVVHHHPRPSERRRGRHRATVCNDLATWWSRLPWCLALRYTADVAWRTPTHVAAALPQIAHAVGHRRPVPPSVAEALRAIKRHERGTSP